MPSSRGLFPCIKIEYGIYHIESAQVEFLVDVIPYHEEVKSL